MRVRRNVNTRPLESSSGRDKVTSLTIISRSLSIFRMIKVRAAATLYVCAIRPKRLL